MIERGFSPGQILIVLAGAASLALGIAAVATTGLDGPLSQPVDEVLGWNHTALLGIIEIAAGAVMILSGLRAGARWLGGLVGLAAIVGGALVLGRLDWTMNELGAERDFGWVAIGIGAVAVIGAAIPRVRRRSRADDAGAVLTAADALSSLRDEAPTLGVGRGLVAPGRLADRGRFVRSWRMANHDVHGEVASGWEGVPAVLRASLERGEDVGASVCVYHRGVPVVDIAGGTFTRDGGAYDRSTLQLVFSTTKGITAIAVGMCAGRGFSTTTRRSPPTGPSSPPPARATRPSPSCSATSSGSSPSTASRSSRPSTGTRSRRRSPPPHRSGRSAAGTDTTPSPTAGWPASWSAGSTVARSARSSPTRSPSRSASICGSGCPSPRSPGCRR